MAKNSVSQILSGVKCSTDSIELKNLGPPRPNLCITQTEKATSTKNSYSRTFKPYFYNYADWLCGCEERNRFFCYPCLVMGVKDKVWTEDGYADIKHLNVKIKKHKLSEKHINSCIDYAVLGKVDIRSQLDSAYRLKIQKLNEEVTNNRYILGKLIDAVKFCGAFELSLREHDGKETYDNPGIFRGVVNLMSELDSTLKHHIDKTNNQVFSGLSKTIQNELLDSIYAVCVDIIKNEIAETEFIAIQADETTDCATLSQLAFVVRYELNGVISERFVSFVMPEGHDAVAIAEDIFKELAKLNIDKCPMKVIAQSYNGTSVMSGRHSGVQALIKSIYPQAHYVHCYAHQLNLIIERCATQNKQVKIFFSNVEAFSTFFSQSPKRTAVLDEVVKKRIPKSSGTSLNFKSRIISTLFTYKIEIGECLNIILDDDSNDYSTINKATGLLYHLKNTDFIFWLTLFNKIMPHCDLLFHQLQSKLIDCIGAFKYIGEFKSNIQNIRNSSDLDECFGLLDEPQSPSDSLIKTEFPRKRTRFEDKMQIVAKEVCDLILSGIENRFTFLDHLSVAKLFEPSLFPEFKNKFPESELDIAANLFNLNKVELKQELVVIYSRNDFSHARGALRLLNFIYDNNLKDVLPECVKLLRIICTIPMTSAESERCFSTIKRIKTFTRSTMKEDRLSALAMCSIEKELLSTPNFNEQVIDHFAKQKERRMYFCYKQYN